MPLVSKPGLTIFFAHVPKAAGSSIEDYLARRFDTRLTLTDMHYFRLGHRLRGRGVISPPTHMTAEDLEEILPAHIDHSFTVVRDPVERTLSQYRFQSNNGNILTRLSFATWLQIMRACLKRDARCFDNHLRPQTDFVPEDATVFRLEDGLERVTNWLDEVTGSPAPDTTPGHILKAPDRAVSLTRQDLAAIEDMYAGDYARFDYARPSGEGCPSDSLAPLRRIFAAGLARLIIWKQRRAWLR
jgi:hypothetical protein